MLNFSWTRSTLCTVPSFLDFTHIYITYGMLCNTVRRTYCTSYYVKSDVLIITCSSLAPLSSNVAIHPGFFLYIINCSLVYSLKTFPWMGRQMFMQLPWQGVSFSEGAAEVSHDPHHPFRESLDSPGCVNFWNTILSTGWARSFGNKDIYCKI